MLRLDRMVLDGPDSGAEALGISAEFGFIVERCNVLNVLSGT